jgi:hypothetical protein
MCRRRTSFLLLGVGLLMTLGAIAPCERTSGILVAWRGIGAGVRPEPYNV